MKFNYAIEANTIPQRAVVGNKLRTSLTIFNNSTTETVYYGSDVGLTPDDGMVILAQTGWNFLIGLGDDPRTAFHGVTAAGPADGRIAEGFGIIPPGAVPEEVE